MALNTETPVVMFQAGGYLPLTIARSLGRLGIKVYCINSDHRAYVCSSRYCTATFLWEPGAAREELFIEYLAGLADDLRCKPLLIPVGDVQNNLVDRHRAVLAQSYVLPMPAPGSTQRLFRKDSLYDLCLTTGVPTPRTIAPASREEAIGITSSWHYPLVIKGVDPDQLNADTGRRLRTVANVQELDEVYQAYATINPDNLLIQELIPNSEKERWVVAAYFDQQGQKRFALAGNKLRQSPITGGVTTLAVTANCPTVLEHLSTLIHAVDYRGPVGADFCLDTRDGQHKILDVNPRLGANFRALADRNGLDIARTMYLDLTGQQIPDTEPHYGRTWVVEDKDFWAARAQSAIGLLAWAWSLTKVDELAHIAIDDMRPSLLFMTRWLSLSVKQLLRAGGRLISHRKKTRTSAA
jgi:predicted ATP-grasp superfamily ATP-dependent carboligase